jgi:hypothetical protein
MAVRSTPVEILQQRQRQPSTRYHTTNATTITAATATRNIGVALPISRNAVMNTILDPIEFDSLYNKERSQ